MSSSRLLPRLSVAALAVALLSLMSGGLLRKEAPAPRSEMETANEVDPPNAARPSFVLGNANDVRALATDGAFVWAATSGGLDRYTLSHETRELAHRRYGPAEGLDTLDIRAVDAHTGRVVVQTAESRCVLHGERFACKAARPPAPAIPRDETFAGAPITQRLAVAAGDFIATRGAGLWLARPGEKALQLGSREGAPRSFVHEIVFYKDHAYLATFDDGLLRVDANEGTLARQPELWASASVVGTGGAVQVAPARMINDVATDGTTLWIAANEGLFFSRDGTTFERVEGIEPRSVTSLAIDEDRVYATTNAALWRLRAPRPTPHAKPKIDANWWRPAGTRSLQAVSVSAGNVFLASEDRGVIAFDGAGKFTAHDRLSGLPTSWVLALASDAHGGVYAATLRDGVFHLDARGTWAALSGLPGSWTLGVFVDRDHVCVGTQSGAACWDDPTKGPTLVLRGLPDPRVHDVQRIGNRLFVGTEAGLALYEVKVG